MTHRSAAGRPKNVAALLSLEAHLRDRWTESVARDPLETVLLGQQLIPSVNTDLLRYARPKLLCDRENG